MSNSERDHSGSTASIFQMLLVVSCLMMPACQPKLPEDPGVLAEFDGGSVKAAELDRAILALPPNERRRQIQSPERLEKIIRGLAFKKVLKNQIQKEGFKETKGYTVIRDQLQREATVTLYLQNNSPETPVSEKDLKAYVAQHPEYRHRDEERLVYTFFKSFDRGVTREDTQRKVEAIRRRIEAGESFNHVAETESESETRHRGGFLGWFSPGQLPRELDQLVFSLKEGGISHPIMTKDGVHLFWVKTVLPARNLSERELQETLLPIIQVEKRKERIEKALAQLGGKRAEIPSSERLKKILREADPKFPMLKTGKYELSLGDFRGLFQYLKDSKISPKDLLYDISITEPLRQMIDERNLVPKERVSRLIQARLEEKQLSEFANTKMRKWLVGQDQLLRKFYQNEKARFQTPLRMHLIRLVIPLGREPLSQMRQLENASSHLKVDALPQLANSLGGRVVDLGTGTLPQLLRKDPGVRDTVVLEQGALGAPHRCQEGLSLYGVRERIEPQPLTFEKAKNSVVNTMLSEQSDLLREQFSKAKLEKANFRIFSDRLQKLKFTESPRETAH